MKPATPTICPICRQSDQLRPYLVREPYAFYRCQRCDLVLRSEPDTRADYERVKELYAQGGADDRAMKVAYTKAFVDSIDIKDSFADKFADYTTVAERNASWILRDVALEPGDRVLEVGGADGLLLHRLHSRISGLESTLVEPSPVMSARAEERGEGRVICGTLDQAELPTGSFDVALLIGNLMLHTDPVATLSEIARVLVPGGRVVLDVKNNTTTLRWLGRRLAAARVLRERLAAHVCQVYPPRTRFFFTKTSARLAVEVAGLSVRRMKTVHPRSLSFDNRVLSDHTSTGSARVAWVLSRLDAALDSRAWIWMVAEKPKDV